MPKAPSNALSVTFAAFLSVILFSTKTGSNSSTDSSTSIVLPGNGTEICGSTSVTGIDSLLSVCCSITDASVVCFGIGTASTVVCLGIDVACLLLGLGAVGIFVISTFEFAR